jgi:TetR/AcrR family transcriptional repressor of lmrAB and yxaGH operons
MSPEKTPPDQLGSRIRLLAAADRLFRRHGYSATTISAIAKEGRAPMGSVYFHFPNGKEQLAAEALRFGADAVSRRMAAALETGPDAAAALASCALAWADALEVSAWSGGCPVAPTALEMSTISESLRRVSCEIFAEWQELLSARLLREGFSKPLAAELAEQTLALMEGAELLARVRRTREPLENAAKQIRRTIEWAKKSRVATPSRGSRATS